MSKWKVTLFGKFNIEFRKTRVHGLEARKVQELFCYLLLTRNCPQPRELLCETLWGDQLSIKSRKCLRQTLWLLQSALSSKGISYNNPNLIIDNSWIQLNVPPDFWLDIAEFEKVFDATKGKRSQGLNTNDFKLLRYAIDLYKGDFLAGWYQDWCIFERERFQMMYLILLDKLVQYCELRQLYDVGLMYAMEILRQDRAYERAHRQLMRLYCLRGNRVQALYQYEQCSNALKKELGVEPSENTKQLYEQIRLGTFKQLIIETEKSAAFTESHLTLDKLLNRLDEVSETLAGIKRQIQDKTPSLPNNE